ncbi:MAG: VOC family protein [Beijerinckiaceae bacterium]|nr:VOC family protein [Beijerinckiaceae bacterium]MCI0734672.1 VOC family protein [Beijerinckiaceae bacterium]
MLVQPYLTFNGRCEEAIEFYKKVLGAEVLVVMRFKENPDKPGPDAVPPGLDEKIMHSCLRIGETSIMASDGMCQSQAAFQGFSLTLTVADDAEAKRLFNALADGGQVQMPLAKCFFSSSFGMVADRFGVPWAIVVMS